MYKNSQTTSTKCQYQAAISNPKWWFDEKCSVVCVCIYIHTSYIYIYIYIFNIKDVSCDGIKINFFSKEKLKATLYLPPAEWPAKIRIHVRDKHLVHFRVSVIWMYKEVPLSIKPPVLQVIPPRVGSAKHGSRKSPPAHSPLSQFHSNT